jgi:hypothetical protein
MADQSQDLWSVDYAASIGHPTFDGPKTRRSGISISCRRVPSSRRDAPAHITGCPSSLIMVKEKRQLVHRADRPVIHDLKQPICPATMQHELGRSPLDGCSFPGSSATPTWSTVVSQVAQPCFADRRCHHLRHMPIWRPRSYLPTYIVQLCLCRRHRPRRPR